MLLVFKIWKINQDFEDEESKHWEENLTHRGIDEGTWLKKEKVKVNKDHVAKLEAKIQ